MAKGDLMDEGGPNKSKCHLPYTPAYCPCHLPCCRYCRYLRCPHCRHPVVSDKGASADSGLSSWEVVILDLTVYQGL